ncbi:MAG: tetratricopeptide repeat protein [Methanospirillum sp.]|uniref:tetratricopeptide repeat protein n=1 Tax=Methanospirillum sp. TaxID=45200 RepID=UPI00236A3D85|nr:tetratricopeptide repeat protein [Methanospirillum sp.]MDD1728780.1 tetratricopeptide repeat protein [Methanospirillum sp.]
MTKIVQNVKQFRKFFISLISVAILCSILTPIVFAKNDNTISDTSESGCSMVGTWSWMDVYDNTFFSNHSSNSVYKSNGTLGLDGVWVQSGNKITIIWGDGKYADDLVLSSDCNSIVGKNQLNDRVWGTRFVSQPNNKESDLTDTSTIKSSKSDSGTSESNQYSSPGYSPFVNGGYSSGYSNSVTDNSNLNTISDLIITDPHGTDDKSIDWITRGSEFQVQGDNSEAIKSFDEALKIDPNNEVAWNNKGTALIGLGEFDQAIEAFNNAIESNGKYEDALINKGIILKFQGKYDEAIEAFNKALAINPNNTKALNEKTATETQAGNNNGMGTPTITVSETPTSTPTVTETETPTKTPTPTPTASSGSSNSCCANLQACHGDVDCFEATGCTMMDIGDPTECPFDVI